MKQKTHRVFRHIECYEDSEHADLLPIALFFVFVNVVLPLLIVIVVNVKLWQLYRRRGALERKNYRSEILIPVEMRKFSIYYLSFFLHLIIIETFLSRNMSETNDSVPHLFFDSVHPRKMSIRSRRLAHKLGEDFLYCRISCIAVINAVSSFLKGTNTWTAW